AKYWHSLKHQALEHEFNCSLINGATDIRGGFNSSLINGATDIRGGIVARWKQINEPGASNKAARRRSAGYLREEKAHVFQIVFGQCCLGRGGSGGNGR